MDRDRPTALSFVSLEESKLQLQTRMALCMYEYEPMNERKKRKKERVKEWEKRNYLVPIVKVKSKGSSGSWQQEGGEIIQQEQPNEWIYETFSSPRSLKSTSLGVDYV